MRTTTRRGMTAATAVTAVLVGGCGGATDVASEGPSQLPTAAESYDGPLYVPDARYGAAGEVVECRHRPGSGRFHTDEVYGEGATSDSPDGAVRTALSEGLFLDLPDLPLRVAAAEGDRVLFTHVSGGRTTAALVVRDGQGTEGAGGDGWYLESSAVCDLSEFPPEVAESHFGTEIWTEPDGQPALTTRVVSRPGPEHCDWQSMTFLSVGRDRTYVRDPLPDLRGWLDAEYVASMPLPEDAVDTGFSREGDRLWLSPTGDRAYVGRPAEVEAWPRADLACG